ncbi:MAG: ribonuclease III domain-containing protein, partial [Eubacteriales bacterium]
MQNKNNPPFGQVKGNVLKHLEIEAPGDIFFTALTHPSYTFENPFCGLENNQRLEFLGDAVLDFVIGEYLYRTYPDRPEGELTKMRA